MHRVPWSELLESSPQLFWHSIALQTQHYFPPPILGTLLLFEVVCDVVLLALFLGRCSNAIIPTAIVKRNVRVPAATDIGSVPPYNAAPPTAVADAVIMESNNLRFFHRCFCCMHCCLGSL